MSQYDHVYEHMVELGMARLMFASVWADYVEQVEGCALGGQILDQAPETPDYVIKDAYRLAGMIEQINGCSLVIIAYRAWKADGGVEVEGEHSILSQWTDPLFLQDLGGDLAMQSMGHGVSWFDDHEKFDLKLPYMEYSHFDLHDDEYPIPVEGDENNANI